MKIIILILIFILCINTAFSQIIKVKDSESGMPLELATLRSAEPKAVALTNSYGQADAAKFKGSEQIEISSVGYKTKILSWEELQEKSFLVFLTPTVLNMNQVVVSAVKWNQPKQDIPIKVSSINPTSIALQNPQTAADLLGASHEVFIQKSQQGGGSPMIRGFSTNRLLYTVDGVRMNTAIFRSGNLQNVISIDPFSMESAEVLFGPGSVIYGSDAIGGVMSFRTLSPQFSLSDEPHLTGKAVTRYSSANNEKTAHIDINVGWKKFASVTSISTYDYGDLKMGGHGPNDYLRNFYVERINGEDAVVENNNPQLQKPAGYSQMNIMQKFHYLHSNELDIEYGFHYSETSDYPRYDRLIRTKNADPRSAEWYYGPQVWMMNNLSISHKNENFFYDEMTLRPAYQYFKESRNDRDFGGAILYRRVEQVDAFSVNADFKKSLGEITDFYYGLEWVYDEVTSEGTDKNIETGESEKGASRYPQADWSSYAAYLTIHHNFTEKLMAQAGARFNLFALDADFSDNIPYYPIPQEKAEINNRALTGSLGLMYHPERSWSLSANVSTGFRSPNVDDIGKVFDSEPGSVVVPNPDLEAEYAYNAEAGIAKIFGETLKLDLTGYYTYLDNAMVRRDFTLNGRDSIMYDGEMSRVQAVQNAAKAEVYGIQAGIELNLPAGFGFSSRFNWQKGEEELDNGSTGSSRHAAPWFGVSRITYKADGLSMELYAVYNGEKSYENMPEEEKGKVYLYASDENGNPYSPGWYTLNFKAMYRLTEIFSLSAGLENITDRRYRPYSSGLAAAGRNFIIALKAAF